MEAFTLVSPARQESVLRRYVTKTSPDTEHHSLETAQVTEKPRMRQLVCSQ